MTDEPNEQTNTTDVPQDDYYNDGISGLDLALTVASIEMSQDHIRRCLEEFRNAHAEGKRASPWFESAAISARTMSEQFDKIAKALKGAEDRAANERGIGNLADGNG